MAKKESAAVKKPRRVRRIIFMAAVAAALLIGFGIAFNIAGMGVKTNNLLASLPITGNYFKVVGEKKTPEQLEREELDKTRKLLEEERAHLDELAGNLASWELQLKAMEEELASQKEAVEDLQQRLDARVKSIEELVVYYEKMDAADAVEILDNISDNRLVITILRNMKEQKCSEILAAMEPKKAARLMETMSIQ
jgi:flagellar motility protein MotE (MotC chaperone)